jgi:hypothetical protein
MRVIGSVLRRGSSAVAIGSAFVALSTWSTVVSAADDAGPPPAEPASPPAGPESPAAGFETPATAAASPATAAASPATEAMVPSAAPPAITPPAAGDAKGEKKKRQAEGNYGQVEVSGRVFARAALARQPRSVVDETGTPIEEDVDSLDMSVPSARLRAKYRAPVRWLSAEVEVDFAGNPELKDGYIRARPEHFLVQAGQFKMPFSAFRLASPWELPIADRGFVDDALTDRFQVAGRRAGWAFGIRQKGGVRPELVIGSFQGSVIEDVTDGDFEPIDELTLDSQNLVARATVRLGDVDVGAAYEHRVGSAEELEVEHYATGNLDAVLDTHIGSGGLRVWLESVFGESFYEHESKPADDSNAIFVSARAIAAYRFGGLEYGELYVEPYGMFAMLDPDTEVTADTAFEGVAGVNVGLWELVRLGLQAEFVRVGRNFPRAVYLGQTLDRTALVLQAGLEF